MTSLFRNVSSFSIIYFAIVIICLFLRLLANDTDYMYMFRPLTLIPLIIYYFQNSKETRKKIRFLVIIAMLFFFVGELFFSYKERISLSSAGILFYSVGKFLFCASFSNEREFNSKLLKIYLLIIFVLIIVVMSLVFNNLEAYMVPVLIYLFASVFMCQYALMRKDEVNKESFILVTIGMTTFIMVDSLAALKYFYLNNQYIPQEVLIFIYALSQYLIITGLVREKQELIKVE